MGSQLKKLISFFLFLSFTMLMSGCSFRTGSGNTDPDAWFNKYHVIAHSGGGIDGNTFTNSMEAWELSYERGVRIIDADLRYSADKELILRHKWSDDMGTYYENDGKAMDHDRFMQGRIMDIYTPMDLESMVDFMIAHEDVFVACDAKEDIEAVYTDIVKKAEEKNAEEILDRIIVSFYEYGDLSLVRNVYPFSNYAIRQYPNHKHDYKELAKYCVSNDIPVVMLNKDFLSDDGLDILTKKGVAVWAAVVDDMAVIDGCEGVYGVVSNVLSETDFTQ